MLPNNINTDTSTDTNTDTKKTREGLCGDAIVSNKLLTIVIQNVVSNGTVRSATQCIVVGFRVCILLKPYTLFVVAWSK